MFVDPVVPEPMVTRSHKDNSVSLKDIETPRTDRVKREFQKSGMGTASGLLERKLSVMCIQDHSMLHK